MPALVSMPESCYLDVLIMKFRAIILGYSLLFTAGCALHTVDVQQGNVITEEMLQKLQTGQNKQQVRFIMGSALLEDPFHADRWDYIYTLKPGEENNITVLKHLQLTFKDDTLTKIDKRMMGTEKK